MMNEYLTQLLNELRSEGIPDPLQTPFNLAALWDDLARLAGEIPPAMVRRLLEQGATVGEAASGELHIPEGGPRVDRGGVGNV